MSGGGGGGAAVGRGPKGLGRSVTMRVEQSLKGVTVTKFSKVSSIVGEYSKYAGTLTFENSSHISQLFDFSRLKAPSLLRAKGSSEGGGGGSGGRGGGGAWEH